MLGQRLHIEWRHLVASPQAAAALARWRHLEPAIGEFDDLDSLRGVVHDRADQERGDRVLAALVRLAAITGHADQLAARVVLQLLIPGAIRLSQSLTTMIGDANASEATVFAELTILIRTYPWQRRPGRIAANLLLDCRQQITRHYKRSKAESPAGLAPAYLPAAAGDWGWQDVMDLLRWARRRKVLTPVEAGVLLASHVLDIPISELTTAFGFSRSTLYVIRAHAEGQLRRALLAERSGQPEPLRRRGGGRPVTTAARVVAGPPAGRGHRPAPAAVPATTVPGTGPRPDAHQPGGRQ